MKKIFILLLAVVIFVSCGMPPKNFTYRYESQDTGLKELIDINGYYISQHGCDSTFYSMYMFYPDGLFTIATTSKILPGLVDCFRNGGKSNICRYPLWGTYRLEGDLIKTQVMRTEGNGFVIFRDYRILPDGKGIVNVSDYVQPEYTNLGYMANYPSFMQNQCESAAIFYPLDTKRDPAECPFIGKKWFNVAK